MDVQQSIKMKPEEIGGKLSHRERFRRVMHFQGVDYVPHMEFGYWGSLKETWFKEGYLPESFRDADGKILMICCDESGNIADGTMEAYFGFSQICVHYSK